MFDKILNGCLVIGLCGICFGLGIKYAKKRGAR